MAAYVAALVAWAVLRGVTGDRLLPVLCLSYLGVWLFSPLVFYVPWVFLACRGRRAVLLLVPVGMFLWQYGPLFLPRGTHVDPSSSPITVLTLNLRSPNRDTDTLTAALLASQADVIALQEVSRYHQRHLSAALTGRYPYHTYYLPSGLAIYSIHPITVQEILPLEPWPAQGVVVGADTELYLVNAHLAQVGILRSLSTGEANLMVELAVARERQVGQIQEAVYKMGLPAVVACDCNMTDLTASYARMTTTLQDAHRQRGWGLGHTFLVPQGLEIPSPIGLPFQRIDYLFSTPDSRVVRTRVIHQALGSDHLPLVAQYCLVPRTNRQDGASNR
jgi:endonuclease/exonuclease/phosphatase (EEP) superfamily protein YafD